MIDINAAPPSAKELQRHISILRRDKLALISSKNNRLIKLVAQVSLAGVTYYIADQIICLPMYVTIIMLIVFAYIVEKVMKYKQTENFDVSVSQLKREIETLKGKANDVKVQLLTERANGKASTYLNAVEKQGRKLSNYEFFVLSRQLDDADPVWGSKRKKGQGEDWSQCIDDGYSTWDHW